VAHRGQNLRSWSGAGKLSKKTLATVVLAGFFVLVSSAAKGGQKHRTQVRLLSEGPSTKQDALLLSKSVCKDSEISKTTHTYKTLLRDKCRAECWRHKDVYVLVSDFEWFIVEACMGNMGRSM
jgi:hypothetical protein